MIPGLPRQGIRDAIGGGEKETFSRKFPSPLPRTPFSHPSKIFALIESLFPCVPDGERPALEDGLQRKTASNHVRGRLLREEGRCWEAYFPSAARINGENGGQGFDKVKSL